MNIFDDEDDEVGGADRDDYGALSLPQSFNSDDEEKLITKIL